MSKPSAILMGSKAGAVVALSMILERGWDVQAVVTVEKNLHPWIAGPTLGECDFHGAAGGVEFSCGTAAGVWRVGVLQHGDSGKFAGVRMHMPPHGQRIRYGAAAEGAAISD